LPAPRPRRNAEVVVLEKSPQFLAKVRISGGGRCNVTHACFRGAGAGGAVSARRTGAHRRVPAVSGQRRGGVV